jgi:hypothetical protein
MAADHLKTGRFGWFSNVSGIWVSGFRIPTVEAFELASVTASESMSQEWQGPSPSQLYL